MCCIGAMVGNPRAPARPRMTTPAAILEPGLHDVPLQGIMVVEDGLFVQADGWFYIRRSHPNYDAMVQLIMAAGGGR